MDGSEEETMSEQTWLDGKWKRGPVQFGVCNVDMGNGFIIPLISPHTADQIIADHDAARQRDELQAELDAYRQAWQLPNQPVTQGVVPSAGEVAANAVEEAKMYRKMVSEWKQNFIDMKAERDSIQHQEITAAQVELSAMRDRAINAEATLDTAARQRDLAVAALRAIDARHVAYTGGGNALAREALAALDAIAKSGGD